MYRIRFVVLMIRCLIEPLLPVNAPRSLGYRAWPLIDTDVGRMFTHSYALMMGLARWHLLFGSEFRNLALRNKWAPVTTAEATTYRKSIRAWQAYRLNTRIVTWDDQHFYVEHCFMVKEVLAARTVVEGLVRNPGGILRPQQVFAAAGYVGAAPEPSDAEREEIAALRRLSAEPIP